MTPPLRFIRARPADDDAAAIRALGWLAAIAIPLLIAEALWLLLR